MKQNLIRVRNRLSKLGIEATNQEVWDCAMDICEYDRRKALRMLELVVVDRTAFNRFVSFLAPVEVFDFNINPKKEKLYTLWDLVWIGAFGFLLGVVLTMAFGSKK